MKHRHAQLVLWIAVLVGAVVALRAGAKPAPTRNVLLAAPELYRPPGAVPGDNGPSPTIFPPQTLPLRFSHRRHTEVLGLSCLFCHDQAAQSTTSADRLLPPATRCDACHDADHSDLDRVRPSRGRDAMVCASCHVGHQPSDGNRVRRLVVPAANLHFSHRAHHARNIGCPQCHGQVKKLDLATRDQLPRMRGCLRCHAAPPPAHGDASSDCRTCHLTGDGGRLVSQFSTGPLLPPSWLHNADHGPGWLERHKTVAAQNSTFCSSCHEESECIECHDGRVRPRPVHPNDWLSLHAVAALQDNPRCTSCHRQQSFCLTCHQRTGITMSGPQGNFAERGRFHPPKAQWTDAPRSTLHHAWEAQRNLDACVSCHTERDCALCHATAAMGGPGAQPGDGAMGKNPHPPGFRSRCATALAKNARPCLVCHTLTDPMLNSCR